MINPDFYAQLNEVKDMFTATLEKAAMSLKEEQLNVKIVHVANEFVGKEAQLTHIKNMDIHPNQEGYTKMAEVFANVIWGTYHQPVVQENISLFLAGKQLNTQDQTMNRNGRIFIPIRQYVEALGADVIWEQSTQMARVKYKNQEIAFQNDSDLMTIGQQTIQLSSPVHLLNGRLYVPLRALAEGLDIAVHYVPESRTIFINP